MKRWIRQKFDAVEGLRREASQHTIRTPKRSQNRITEPEIALWWYEEYKQRRYRGSFDEWLRGCIAAGRRKKKKPTS